jgi:hypothetical protein
MRAETLPPPIPNGTHPVESNPQLGVEAPHPNGVGPLENRDRLMVRTLDSTAERLSGIADNLALRRTPGEFMSDTAITAIEAGRNTAGNIGNKVLTTAHTAKEGVNGALDGMRERTSQGKEAVRTFFLDKKAAAEERRAHRIEKRRAKWESRKEKAKTVGAAVLLTSVGTAYVGINLANSAARRTAQRGRRIAEGGRHKIAQAKEAGVNSKESVKSNLSQQLAVARARKQERIAKREARVQRLMQERQARIERQKVLAEKVRLARETRQKARLAHIQARRQARREKWAGRTDKLKTVGYMVAGVAIMPAVLTAYGAKRTAHTAKEGVNGALDGMRERTSQGKEAVRTFFLDKKAAAEERRNTRLINRLSRKSSKAFEKSVNLAHVAALHENGVRTLQKS